MKIHILTLFPESFSGPLQSSLLGKAQEKGLLSVELIQIRKFATDKHRSVDETPYGGGEGMLMRVDVLHAAWKSVQDVESGVSRVNAEPGLFFGVPTKGRIPTIFLSPQGRTLDSEFVKALLVQTVGHSSPETGELLLVCGHYEGVDERFIDLCVDLEVSIGDYVLTGGELPAMVLLDAMARWIPGVIGNERSVTGDSFEGGVLKYPQYTKPREFQACKVPDVLLSGNHSAIESWRREKSLERTANKADKKSEKGPKNSKKEPLV